jgi:hypothetical protein
MQLGSNEFIAFSITPAHEPALARCSECDKIAWRIVGTADRGIKNETPLCIRHFIEACLSFPVLQFLDREFRFDPFGKSHIGAFPQRSESDCSRSVEQSFNAKNLPVSWTRIHCYDPAVHSHHQGTLDRRAAKEPSILESPAGSHRRFRCGRTTAPQGITKLPFQGLPF